MSLGSKGEIRFFGMLGFAMRAGKLIIGTESVCRAMAQGTPRLVLISSDASDGTRKKISLKSEFYGIPYIVLPYASDRVSATVGKTYSAMGIAVTDEGFASEMIKALAPDNT